MYHLGWKPTPVRLGMLQRPKLGQTDAMIDRSAKAIIEKAEPRFRAFLNEERERVAGSINSAIPYAGLSVASFLGSHYLIPERDQTARMVGYGVSAILLGVGVWTIWRGFTEPVVDETTSLPPEPPGVIGEVLSTLVDPTSRKLAAAIVEEAEPRVRAMLAESGQKLSDVAYSVIPWWGVAAAACIGSMVLVPESMPAGKAAAYAASAASFLLGIHQAAATLRTSQEG